VRLFDNTATAEDADARPQNEEFAMRLWRRDAGPDPDTCEHPWRVREVPSVLRGRGAWQVCDLCGAMRLEGPEEMGGQAREKAAALMEAPAALLPRNWVAVVRSHGPTRWMGAVPRQGKLGHESRRVWSVVRRSACTRRCWSSSGIARRGLQPAAVADGLAAALGVERRADGLADTERWPRPRSRASRHIRIHRHTTAATIRVRSAHR